jgi:hypothetical protein
MDTYLFNHYLAMSMNKKPQKKKKKSRKVLPAGGIPSKGGKGVKKTKNRKAVKKLRFKALRRKTKKTIKRIKSVKQKKIIRKVKTRKIKKVVKKNKPRIRKSGRSRVFRRGSVKSGPRVYVGKGLLEQLFESQPKVKVLKFFFRNSQDVFTLKQILRRLRANPLLVRREMGKLEKLGLIKQKRAWLTFERKRGGTKKEQKLVYCINTDFDFFNELKNLILKSTISSREELINNIRKTGNIKILTLAGIFTGDETAKADILIVGDKINSRKLNTFFKDLEAEVGKELNCSVMSTREFNYRYDMYDRFVRDLLGGKSEVLINRINLW